MEEIIRLKVKTQHKPVVKVPATQQQEEKTVYRQEESMGGENVHTNARKCAGGEDVCTNARGCAESRCPDGVVPWTVVKTQSDIYVVLVEHKKKSFSCGSCDIRKLVHFS